MSDIEKNKNQSQAASDKIHEIISNSPAFRLTEIMQKINSIPKTDFLKPTFSGLPITDIKIPTPEERNEYQSASVLMDNISKEALAWKNQLPEDLRPAIIAILNSGIQIQVTSLSQVSFHGIKVEGTIDGNMCSLLSHQSSLQLLCFAEKEIDEEPRRTIGFFWGGHKIEV